METVELFKCHCESGMSKVHFLLPDHSCDALREFWTFCSRNSLWQPFPSGSESETAKTVIERSDRDERDFRGYEVISDKSKGQRSGHKCLCRIRMKAQPTSIPPFVWVVFSRGWIVEKMTTLLGKFFILAGSSMDHDSLVLKISSSHFSPTADSRHFEMAGKLCGNLMYWLAIQKSSLKL